MEAVLKIVTISALLMCCGSCYCATSASEIVCADKCGVKAYLTIEKSVVEGNPLEIITKIEVGDSQRKRMFEPTDPVSIQQSMLFYKSIFSPSQNFMVLPMGDFNGFCVIKTKNAVDSIDNKKYHNIINVRLKSGTTLTSRFLAWSGSNTFKFKFGLSDDWTVAEYNIDQNQITIYATKYFFEEIAIESILKPITVTRESEKESEKGSGDSEGGKPKGGSERCLGCR